MVEKRSSWKSNIGFLLAAVGSAIGLGNIWRFSYLVHLHGGSAFLIPYFVALFVAGIPIMLLEYGLGHLEKGAPPLSFARVNKNWEWIGWFMPLLALFGIMLYYSVVIGWCVDYFFYSFDLKWGSDTQSFFFKKFLEMSKSPFDLGGIRLPIFLATLFVWFICWVICFRDVSHGIEKASMFFMPLLFVLTLFLVGFTFTLKGAPQAVYEHYLKPDFSKILFWGKAKSFFDFSHWDFSVWRDAFSQIFFTLSLGFGIMITYASYLPEKTDITKNAYLTSIINCLYSLIAGTIVFGIIGFMAHANSKPFESVIKGGPQLAFVVYPKAISLLPYFREFFGAVFFFVLIIAGITSGISLIEAFACALTDKFEWSREKTVTIVSIVGFLGSIIFTTKAGLLILDILDHFATNYGLVIGGIAECVIVGWILKSNKLRNHINSCSKMKITFIWDILIRYITPFILLVLLFITLKSDIAKPYGGYNSNALLLYGVTWVFICLIIAVVLTFYPWKPEKLKRVHKPEEDELLV